MLEGVVPFPREFVRRYREKGYWQDKSLAEEFKAVFENYADRMAIIDGEICLTYRQLDELSTNLALNLLDLGFEPLDRVVPQLPTIKEFPILYFALQKIGCIPIAALSTHRYAEISQFVELSGAVACVTPDRHRDFSFTDMITRIRGESTTLKYGIVLGEAPDGFVSLTELIEQPATRKQTDLDALQIDPIDPAVFQLSGGTTGIPKLIPRTHNDYAYNSRTATEVTEVDG
ncbi:MAG: AMP-binding protein, partial [Pseudomonadota bacterium]|nr:AMP-binding protein [Pseudomonadota bacterium]